MRLAGLETMVGRRNGAFVVDFAEDAWTLTANDEVWFADGERLARDYQEVQEGVLMDRAGNLRFAVTGGWS